MIQLEKINSGRPVAIKIFHESYRPETEFKKRNRHEAKLAARNLHWARRINLRSGENDSTSFERAV